MNLLTADRNVRIIRGLDLSIGECNYVALTTNVAIGLARCQANQRDQDDEAQDFCVVVLLERHCRKSTTIRNQKGSPQASQDIFARNGKATTAFVGSSYTRLKQTPFPSYDFHSWENRFMETYHV